VDRVPADARRPRDLGFRYARRGRRPDGAGELERRGVTFPFGARGAFAGGSDSFGDVVGLFVRFVAPVPSAFTTHTT